jgi:hypothetical protein
VKFHMREMGWGVFICRQALGVEPQRWSWEEWSHRTTNSAKVGVSPGAGVFTPVCKIPPTLSPIRILAFARNALHGYTVMIILRGSLPACVADEEVLRLRSQGFRIRLGERPTCICH